MEIENAYITLPQGFIANGVHAGLKPNGNPDLAYIGSKTPANVAGVYTSNLVKGHSLTRSISIIRSQEQVRGIIINSGNANACVGEDGEKDAEAMASSVAGLIGTEPNMILTASTGVIGSRLPLDKITSAIPGLIENASSSEDCGHLAERAIMTTDTQPKEVAATVSLFGKELTIAAIAKGSGMIHPNLATMISVFTTDANISQKALQSMISANVKDTYNRVSVDGDTSVCDMVVIMANGASETPEIVEGTEEYEVFKEAFHALCFDLAKMIASDGEGASKLVEVVVNGAKTPNDAYLCVLSICRSPLCKTAIFGQDANCGRFITALGYSGADIDPDKISMSLSGLPVYQNGVALPFDEEIAKEKLSEHDILIQIELNDGDYSDRMWTCDFTYDYVKINASYRS
ncbi:MAG: bifunctional glutamate N-acetyltransferase/amino-acid acetyltransferase ArgJ [Clostridiales bacterium]|nr:bifunctional glutamate N-acetyltransferase/amino-acid acetyltransferase ArgJ [Clostridiales bacterium]